MKTNLLLLTICATAILFVGCAKKEAAPADEKKSPEPESRVHHGTNGETVITLDSATQKLMGLQVTPIATAELSPELKGFGRVLDPAVLAAAVADFVSAFATAEASRKELDRSKALAGQNNISTRNVETAEALALRDQSLLAAAKAKLLAAAGKTLGERSDLATLVQSLATGASALVRVDLPAGETLKGEPTGARLITLAEGAAPIAATFVGGAPAVDPQTQAQGFLFLVQANAAKLTPGAAVTGYLKLSGTAQTGVSVPREAVLRFNGATWVYLQTGDETFTRTAVTLGSPLAEGWFVAEGLKVQDKLVTVGGQQLLSEELKGQIGGD